MVVSAVGDDPLGKEIACGIWSQDADPDLRSQWKLCFPPHFPTFCPLLLLDYLVILFIFELSN